MERKPLTLRDQSAIAASPAVVITVNVEAASLLETALTVGQIAINLPVRRCPSGRKSKAMCERGCLGDATLISRKKKSELRYCVFNKTRESFLSLSVAAADTHLTRLRGLLGRVRLNSDEGIWVIPCQGIHTIGVLFAVDLIYLDARCRVIHLTESFGTFRIGPIRRKCSSVLELPTRTIYSSQTQVGDELLICSPREMEEYLREKNTNNEYKAASG
jgi:uncharacterized membrane protein (UPF0127 family)